MLSGKIVKQGDSPVVSSWSALVYSPPDTVLPHLLRKPSRPTEEPSRPHPAIDMKPTSAQVSILALVAWSAGLVSAGAGPSPEAKKQYALQWQALSDECKSSLMTVVDSKSEISKCSFAGKLFNDVVSKSAVVSVRWPPAAM